MSHKVGPKGQVVIPKDLRDELGIQPGDEVTFWRDGDHAAVRPMRSAQPLKGRFAASALVDELARDRASDLVRETTGDRRSRLVGGPSPDGGHRACSIPCPGGAGRRRQSGDELDQPGRSLYIVRRLHGHDAAHTAVRDLRPQLDPDLPDEERVLAAATIKAEHPMPSGPVPDALCPSIGSVGGTRSRIGMGTTDLRSLRGRLRGSPCRRGCA